MWKPKLRASRRVLLYENTIYEALANCQLYTVFHATLGPKTPTRKIQDHVLIKNEFRVSFSHLTTLNPFKRILG